jgi:hypothetical protein
VQSAKKQQLCFMFLRRTAVIAAETAGVEHWFLRRCGAVARVSAVFACDLRGEMMKREKENTMTTSLQEELQRASRRAPNPIDRSLFADN